MENKTDEQKLIQQHLANERTYLAWIRTAIALVGIGFLATTLHINAAPDAGAVEQNLVMIVSLSALGLGVLTIIGATLNYYAMRKNINESRFRSSQWIIGFMTSIAVLLVILVSIYIFVVG
ncbi:YidH family protein [Salimicrobium halophilum]|uniref:Putative membrane protein n=1 Tax=Salimicrobium halophilum TaxID=86666 RepID=A0A1G8RIK6_9BACI|nr:DUF202 domain-containing protein [Salimicrobium halophilum]SDJ16771.1 putative membrane protein [Salimicrobium halophilum]